MSYSSSLRALPLSRTETGRAVARGVPTAARPVSARRSLPTEDRMAELKPGVKSSTFILPCFLFVELVIMAGTVLLAYYFEYTDTFPVHVQGFFCYDRTLSKPYPGPDEGSKVPPVLIYSMVSTIPTFTILAGELTSFFLKPEGPQEKTIVTADCCYFNPLLRRIVRFLGVYSFGLFTTTIFANAGQVVTGNQTPHFLSACRPNYTALGCHSATQYITERRACTGSPLMVASARKSFPSKDAALSFYAAVYIVVRAADAQPNAPCTAYSRVSVQLDADSAPRCSITS